jgi:hypothetical protein
MNQFYNIDIKYRNKSKEIKELICELREIG